MGIFRHQVDREVLDLAVSQRDAALQMLAALFLTETEAKTVPAEANDEGEIGLPPGWVADMQQDVTVHYRDEVLTMLRKVGIMCNSHAGFPLAAFRGPEPSYELATCFADLRKFCAEYSAQNVPSEYGWLKRRLLAVGHSPENVQYALSETGGAEPMAMLEQMSRLHQAKQGVQKPDPES